jgi:hypothetical protein
MAQLNNWDDNLAFSKGAREMTDIDTIKQLLPNCKEVIIVEDPDMQRAGVDYVAVLEGGATVNIDSKGRTRGAAKYWKTAQPELALEVWSVMPEQGKTGTPGWTFDTSKQTHMVLYHFDDVPACYLIGYQSLRMAAVSNYADWYSKYCEPPQRSKRGDTAWKSQAMFVPVDVVLQAIRTVTEGLRS